MAKIYRCHFIYCQKREEVLNEGITLVRACIGYHYEELTSPDGNIEIIFGPLNRKDIGAPPPHKTSDGRINPRGISYLYLSDDIETALIEVRPWLKQEVTVGYFEITKNL